LFGALTGLIAALLLTTNAGVFGLARYAILDLPFTLFLFGGVAAVTVAMLRRRRGLEYTGYVLIGLATATKGPLALVLCGLTFLLASILSGEARERLLALHWVRGLLIAVGIGAPWPLYMLWRFGQAFVDGYVLNENIRLFAVPMYSGQPGWWFYLSILAVGMLPWTSVLIARAFVLARSIVTGGDAADLFSVLLWSWTIAIVAFFSFSQFKLDHYVFPTAPALCIVCARVWNDARERGIRTAAIRWGLRLIGPTLIVAGAALAYAALVPLDLGRSFVVVPATMVAAGIVAARYGWTANLPRVPLAPLVGLAVLYVGVAGAVIPKLEQRKVVPDIARWVASHASGSDRVATFRLNRWNTAYRFYVDRPVTVVESDEEAREFFGDPSPFYCVMTGQLYDALRSAGVPLRIAYERDGMWVTSGRALWRSGNASTRFVVATSLDAEAAPVP
jgi:4-amino-4-deoxy-L-arabinose transferase-like glycosyltransferase